VIGHKVDAGLEKEKLMMGDVMRRALAGSLIALFAGMQVAVAAPRTVVLPFDLELLKKEEDFYLGPSKPSPEEQARLQAVHAELTKILSEDGRHDIVDISPISKDIEEAAPLVDCNGCEVDLAKKVNGELLYTGLVDKASDTLLSMRIMEIDVASGKMVRAGSVVIQGNTDDAWMRGVRWIMKNRFAGEAAK
jgi:hypothetical protein